MDNRNYRTGFMITLVLALAVLLASVVFYALLDTTRNTLALTEAQLTNSQIEQTATRSSLATTQDELATTRSSLAAAQDQLATTRSSLATAQDQLGSAQKNLVAKENDLATTSNTLKYTQNELKSTQIIASSLQNDLTQAEAQVDNLQTNINRMSSSSDYFLNDPTFATMQTFLSSDRTNLNPYVPGTYVSWNYAADVIASAATQHIRCGFVYVAFVDSAHAAVVFNTTDKGLVYIEPQSDDIVLLSAGTHYYQSIITKPGYDYPKPSYDDTVTMFVSIW